MALVDLSITEFTELLGSDAPAPGGGSASGLCAALGAALTSMVASLSTGRAKYKKFENEINEILERSNSMRKEFLELIDRDTESFNTVTAALALPKSSDDEKAVRAAAMQKALKICTQAPYDLMCLCISALELTHKAIGKTNTSAASDLGVSALCLKAALQGAWLNVLINLGGIKDEAFVAEYKQAGEHILEKALVLADNIYNEILTSM